MGEIIPFPSRVPNSVPEPRSTLMEALFNGSKLQQLVRNLPRSLSVETLELRSEQARHLEIEEAAALLAEATEAELKARPAYYQALSERALLGFEVTPLG